MKRKPSCEFKCERRAPLCSDGLSLAELEALAREGQSTQEKKMDEKMMGVVRHILTAVGAMFVYWGYTDDATWAMVSGSMATMIGFVWSWMVKDA